MKALLFLVFLLPASSFATEDNFISRRYDTTIVVDLTQAIAQRAKLDQLYVKEARVSKKVGSSLIQDRKSLIEKLPMFVGDKPPRAWPKATEGCSSVECILTNIYQSRESALRILNIFDGTGYVVSAGQSYNYPSREHLFSNVEIRRIDLALRLLPKHLYHLKSLDMFVTGDSCTEDLVCSLIGGLAVPGDNGLFHKKPGVIISYYDDMHIDQSMERFLHEFGHQVDMSFGKVNNLNPGVDKKMFTVTSGFEKISWISNMNNHFESQAKPGDPFGTEYARSNPFEDFAETFAIYVVNPQQLQTTEWGKEKYKFMRDFVFKGHTYPISGFSVKNDYLFETSRDSSKH